MATLFMICGLPGSGKTTLGKRLEKEHRAIRLAPDEWMSRIVGTGYDDERRAAVEAVQWELAQRLLELGANVILESGFWSRREREEFRARAKELGVESELYFLDVSRAELVRRLRRRNQELPPHTFTVNEQDLDTWLRSFESPTADEEPITLHKPHDRARSGQKR